MALLSLAALPALASATAIRAELCAQADLLSQKCQKAQSLASGSPGFAVSITSSLAGQALVNVTWQADPPPADPKAAPLGRDTLVLSQGQSKFVAFRAAKGLAPGKYRLLIAVAGQKDLVLPFEVAPAAGAGKQETVSQALTRVFKTKKGPEAAGAGAKVITEFFDKEMSSPAPKGQAPAAKPGPKAAPPARPAKVSPPAPAKAGPVEEPLAPPSAPAKAGPLPTPPAPAAAPAPAATKAVASGRSLSLTANGLSLVLARAVGPRREPRQTPPWFFSEDSKIYLAIRSSDPGLRDMVEVRWLARRTRGLKPGKKLSGSRTVLRGNSWNTGVFMRPSGGFWPGGYRVEVLKAGKVLAGLDFVIKSQVQAALLLSKAGPQVGYNLALATLGGKVVSATSQSNGTYWAKEGLNDGFGYGGDNCKPRCGWASAGRNFPQELVFSFYQGREPRIKGLVINGESCSGDFNCLSSLPRLVEVWVSRQSASQGYKLAATRRLLPATERQFIPLPGLPAKFVKLVIKSNYGGSRRTQLAEVEILEDPAGPSILQGHPVDLALPSLGGSVLRYSSQRYGHDAVRLLQQQPDGKVWRSEGPKLPQEFTFCLKGHQEALIDRLELDLSAIKDPASRPRQVAVSLSSQSPFAGFQEAARLEVPAAGNSLLVPLNRRARYVRLSILENQGGKYTSLGKVSIREGAAKGYVSLLARPFKPLASSALAAPKPDPGLVTSLVKPGLSPAQAPLLALGRRIRAEFRDFSQRHYYTLDLAGDRPGMLNLELMGHPFLRTAFVLKDQAGRQVAAFNPKRSAGQETMVSWLIKPGRYLLEASTTPANIVLAWDVSGSMARHTDLLQKAVTGFLQKVRPSEKIALIAFNNNLHLLVREFTSDKKALLAAVSGKFKAEMATRLYDAVEQGIKMLNGAQGAGAMVVMTDGVDMGSMLKAPQFWDLLQANPVRIFTIGLGGELKVNDPKAGISGSHLLRHVSEVGGGRFIYIPGVEQLVDVYRQVATELMSGTAYYLKPTWGFEPGQLMVRTEGERIAQLAAPPRIELVLDGSGSMKTRLGKTSRMQVAKEVLTELIQGLPAEVEVGLRVYGHRIREGRKGDCQDTELVYPFGKLDKKKLIARIRAVKPLGTTPIAYSLAQTVKDFGPSKGEKTVILVTDGKEECKGDLVKTIENLRKSGLDVRLHVVGFAVRDPKTHAQMQKAAQAGKGRYISAADRTGLKKAIAQTLAVPFTVRDSSGREVARGVAGQGLSLPAGYYQVVLDTPKGELVRPRVLVDGGKTTLLKVTKDGPKIGVQVLPPAAP